jgi:fatty acid desaturase
VALITCPDCNNRVSAEAEKCVHCGRPIRAKRHRLGVRAGMGIILMAIGLYLLAAGSVMPGAVWFGLFMLAFGGVVLAAILWKAATS